MSRSSLGGNCVGFQNEFGLNTFIDVHTIGGRRMQLVLERDEEVFINLKITDEEGIHLMHALQSVFCMLPKGT